MNIYRLPEVLLSKRFLFCIFFLSFVLFTLVAALPDACSAEWNIETVGIAGNNVVSSSIVTDSSDNVHIVYIDNLNDYLMYATNVSGSWATETVESSTSVQGAPSIAIDASDRVHISYLDWSRRFLKHVTNVTGSWVTETVDSSGRVSGSSSIAIDSSNKIHISYGKAGAGGYNDLWYANNVSGEWITVSIESDGSTGSYNSIALDSSDKVHIGYVMLTGNGTLKYATNRSGSWVIETVENGVNAAFSSIVIDTLDFAHISYQAYSVGRLKYATNASGSWIAETVDNNLLVGHYSSIAMSSSDNAHISYYDDRNEDLKYAANTSGSWVLETIDSVGDVGKYSAIVLDTFDYAHISYIDTTNGALKYATSPRSDDDIDNDGDNYTENQGDCDDSNALINPEAQEVCDGVDNDCNGSVDEGFTDSDGDGYPGCGADCDDSDPEVNPGVLEVPYNGKDDDCNTVTRDDDLDYDGYSLAADCDDNDAWVNPGVDEISENCKDDDCNAATPDSTTERMWDIECVDSTGDRAGDVGQHTSVALDSLDNVHISYTDSMPGYNDKLKYASNTSGSWLTETVDNVGGLYTSLAVDSYDKVHISYLDSESKALKYATNSPGSWYIETLDNTTLYSFTSSIAIAIDSSDNVHIAYLDILNSCIKYVSNTTGSWLIETLDCSGYISSKVSIAVDSLDKIHIAYTSEDSEGINFIKHISNSSGSWVDEAIIASGIWGNVVSIALDSNDNVHIGYFEAGLGYTNLKYTTNISGSWIIETVKNDAYYGTQLSMALNSSDNVHMSYHVDLTRGGLFHSMNFFGPWVTEIVDSSDGMYSSSSGVGYWPSMALDSMDRVHISYYDKYRKVLLYARNNTDDTTPPAAVSDLSTPDATFHSLLLTWTAVADNGTAGWPAAYYDIRYSTSPITETNWDSATQVNGEPQPGTPGSAESINVNGLDPDTTYYFAMKVNDYAGLDSGLSNVLAAATLAAPAIGVDPNSISDTLMDGNNASHTLTLSNTGGDTLSFISYLEETATPESVTMSVSTKRIAKPPVITSIPEGAKYVPGELIVKFNPNKISSSASSASSLSSNVNKTVKGSIPMLNMEIWKISPNSTVNLSGSSASTSAVASSSDDQVLLDAIAALSKNPNVEYAEPNYIYSIASTPDDPQFSSLWGLHNEGQTGGLPDADIDAPEAWEIFAGNAEVVVAVIDTGVDYTHEDLSVNMWSNPGEIDGNGLDDDANGFIDDIYGYDFAYDDPDPMDGHFHGTHCAGTIGAAGNNSMGVVGVNHSVQIMAVKFLSDAGSGTAVNAINAILYAVDNGADILSNSWGGVGFSNALEDAIIYANDRNVLFVAAAGNGYKDTDSSNYYPSNYDVPNVISVAATDHNDNKAAFSNWGLTTVDLGAPGVNILSTVLDNSYDSISGTSMAAPHVSGAAALLKGYDPAMSALEIKSLIMDSVDSVSSLVGKTVTGGRLNIANALSLTSGTAWLRIVGDRFGNILPGFSKELTIILDASSQQTGNYEKNIVIQSNDPANQEIYVPITLTVLNTPPTADPNGPYSGSEGEEIILDGSGSYDPDGILLYEWDVDDNGSYDCSSSSPTCSYTYSSPDAYTIRLRVTNAPGATDEATTTAVISDAIPTADFTGTPTSGQEPLTVNFTDRSDGYDQPLDYEWDFDFDGTSDSFEQHPLYVYNDPGTYSVKLTVTDSDGSINSLLKTDYITVTPPVYTLSINKTGSGDGTVTSSPAGIDCGNDCTEVYEQGTGVTLSASTPDARSMFTGWTGGGCSGTSICTTAINADTIISATFDVCPNGPVRIKETSEDYSSLQTAYDNAQDNYIIYIQNIIFTEDLNLNLDKSVILKGGFNCNYSDNSVKTTLNSNMAINEGKVIIENIILE